MGDPVLSRLKKYYTFWTVASIIHCGCLLPTMRRRYSYPKLYISLSPALLCI